LIDECVLLLCSVLFFDTKRRDWLKKRLSNDLFCVKWDVKPQLSQSINQSGLKGAMSISLRSLVVDEERRQEGYFPWLWLML